MDFYESATQDQRTISKLFKGNPIRQCDMYFGEIFSQFRTKHKGKSKREEKQLERRKEITEKFFGFQ